MIPSVVSLLWQRAPSVRGTWTLMCAAAIPSVIRALQYNTVVRMCTYLTRTRTLLWIDK